LRRAIFIVPQREFRAGDILNAGDSVQWHGVAVRIANEELPHVLRISTVIAFGLNVSLPCSAEAIEIVHEKSAHERLQRLIYRGQIDSLLDHFVAVDLHKDLRHVRLERRNESAELGTFARGVEKGLHILRQKRDIFSCAIFQYELESAGSAHARNHRWRESKRDPFTETCEILVHPRLDGFVLFLRLRSFAPRLESNKEKRVVGVRDEAQQTKADDTGGVLPAGGFAQKIFDISTNLAGALKRSRVGQLQRQKNVALIFFRQKAARQFRSEKTSADRQRGEQTEAEESLSDGET